MRLKVSAYQDRRSVIYAIEQIETGRRYIGSAVYWGRRQMQHKWDLNNGKHCNPYLQNSWDKYGETAFRFLVLEEVSKDRNEMYNREKWWIQNTPLLFNCFDTGPSWLGVKRSQSTKDKISAAKKGRYSPPEERERLRKISKLGTIALYGIPKDKRLEINNKISLSLLGRPREARKITASKISAALRGRKCPWSKGVPRPDWVRKKIGDGHRGKACPYMKRKWESKRQFDLEAAMRRMCLLESFRSVLGITSINRSPFHKVRKIRGPISTHKTNCGCGSCTAKRLHDENKTGQKSKTYAQAEFA